MYHHLKVTPWNQPPWNFFPLCLSEKKTILTYVIWRTWCPSYYICKYTDIWCPGHQISVFLEKSWSTNFSLWRFFFVNNAPLPNWWKNWCNSDQWSSYPFICCTPTGEVFLKHLDFVDNRWLITVHYNYWKKMFIHQMLFRKLYHKNQACLQSSSRC